MKRTYLIIAVLVIVVVAGCAKTTVTSREELVTEKLPRPANIWVYDFAATPADVPAESSLAGQPGASSQTAEHIATGKKLGAEIAKDLVKEINAMGMPAKHATAASKPQVNDIVIKGYLVSMEKGRTGERVVIGLGAGSSELTVTAEGFQVTPQWLRKLGYGTLAAKGAKTPGVGVGAATLIATGNPVGLIVTSGMKLYGEESGKSKVEGRADQSAKEIADILKKRFREQGWIQ